MTIHSTLTIKNATLGVPIYTWPDIVPYLISDPSNSYYLIIPLSFHMYYLI